MKTKLFIIRHGETDWNRARRFQGHIDIPLNALGQRQAELLAARLRTETIHALYSSDLQRCIQTATPTATALGLSIIPDSRLRERNYGLFEGQTLEEIEVRHPVERAAWRQLNPDYTIPSGESTRNLQSRIVTTLTDIASGHPDQTLLIFTHGGVLDMIYRAALNLPLDQPRTCLIPNTGVNHVVFESGALRMMQWADDGHLAV